MVTNLKIGDKVWVTSAGYSYPVTIVKLTNSYIYTKYEPTNVIERFSRLTLISTSKKDSLQKYIKINK
jgi:hypothetical protein